MFEDDENDDDNTLLWRNLLNISWKYWLLDKIEIEKIWLKLRFVNSMIIDCINQWAEACG